MEVDIVFAILGGLVGATIGTLKGDLLTDRLATLLPERLHKFFGILLSPKPDQ